MRLTQSIRKEIEDALMRHRFDVRLNAIKVSGERLACDAYDAHYTKRERKWIAKGLELGLIQPFDRWMRVVFGGVVTHMYFGDGEKRWISPGRSTAVFDAAHRLSRRHEKLVAARSGLKAEIETARANVRAVLGSARTIKQLIAEWPEIEPFIPENEKRIFGLPGEVLAK